MKSSKLHRTGRNLVRFAWGVEIIAVSIGFLISMMVSVSVYRELSASESGFSAADITAVMVAGLPFILVAVVELCKIPLATAMMFAKHHAWRIAFLIFIILLSIITFETMLNGFERNFSNLTLSIDEHKDQAQRVQRSIDRLEDKKQQLLYFSLEDVEADYEQSVSENNRNYNRDLDRQRSFISSQLDKIDDSYIVETEDKIEALYDRQQVVYDEWDRERSELQDRIRNLLNSNQSTLQTDKQKLEGELNDLRQEMEQRMAAASFLTRDTVERRYRDMIAEKEQRLYQVSDYAAGQSAFAQQAESEAQLQAQLAQVSAKYQGRIDDLDRRVETLKQRMNDQISEDEALRTRYRNQFSNAASAARRVRDADNGRAMGERDEKVIEYEEIVARTKVIDEEIFGLNEQIVTLQYQINRLVNRNQIYRIAAYIENKENAIEVEKATVGIVALVWFASLAFVCAITGVFLAIAGMYLQKIYSETDEPETPLKSGAERIIEESAQPASSEVTASSETKELAPS